MLACVYLDEYIYPVINEIVGDQKCSWFNIDSDVWGRAVVSRCWLQSDAAGRRIFQFIRARVDLQISHNKSSISMTCFAYDKNFRINGIVMGQKVRCLWVSGKPMVSCCRIL